MGKEQKGYKDTLNLPRTAFKMKANLQQREPEILKKWKAANIYRSIIDSRENTGKQYILHDGPPYANGHIHMGHVLNKLLKDICVKYHSMKGERAPYVPGWDCHGLPVEHQLFKELNITKHDIDQVKFRKKAYKYAMKFVKIQAGEFERLGIFGDWDDPYLTLTKDYEADILVALADLYEKGYIYKDLKPVNWCSSCETALAEAEVEYMDKVSPSILVKFSAGDTIADKPVNFLIWTTTPWTLLANVAVALHPEFMYVVVDVGEESWVMEEDISRSVLAKAGIERYDILEKATGAEMIERFGELEHPFLDRRSVLVPAEYVTKEEGTGCVHTAPGHGQDDYITGKKHGLEIIMPVDDKGIFTADAGEFAGRHINKANPGIIEKMRSDGTLVWAGEVAHSYPHCWRCKKPIIFRATEQWFMSIDHNGLRDDMGKVIREDVKWIPSSGAGRIGAMVGSRPDWCLSRQRYWGVPIPSLKCGKCGKAFTGSEMIRKVAELTRKHGADVWFEKEPKEFCGGKAGCPYCGSEDLVREGDILDVWFDSGVSHKAVLDARKELDFPADMYLEGSDQHRGWFQSSLITSMGMKGSPPYKTVLTHGFVVDGQGKKMSKSVGNVIRPEDVMKKYGADILRLWVSSSDYVGDIKLSDEILARLADGYRKIRNTFRFLLSNINDLDLDSCLIDHSRMGEVDKWMLSRLYGLVRAVNGYYEKAEFYKVYRAVYDFCVKEVSSFYLDVMKDGLYTMAPGDTARRAVQTVLYRILDTLVRVMAPVLAFTCEEVWGHIDVPGREESVHLAFWPDEKEMARWYSEELDAEWNSILDLRDTVMKSLEVKREEGLIGSSLEAAITLYSQDEKVHALLKRKACKFKMVFKVSQAVVSDSVTEGMESLEGSPVMVEVEKASGAKCQRCWNYRDSVGNFEDHPDICERCYQVIREINV